MKIFIRNIKKSQTFKTFEWTYFFVLFLLTTSIFLEGRNLQNLNSSFNNSNQTYTSAKVFHNSKSNNLPNILLAFYSVEESETNNENFDEKIIETDSFNQIPPSFKLNFLPSSFIHFCQSLQMRASIPFFLLHHSLKIPAA